LGPFLGAVTGTESSGGEQEQREEVKGRAESKNKLYLHVRKQVDL